MFERPVGELKLVGQRPFEPLAPRAKAVIVRLAKKVMHMLVEALQPVTRALPSRSARRRAS
jgi:hypothetical protein